MNQLKKVYYKLNLKLNDSNSRDIEHQYHYGCLLLCSILLDEPPEKWFHLIDQQVDSLLKYGTSDFVLESILLCKSISKFSHPELSEIEARIKTSAHYKCPKYHAVDYKYLYYINNGEYDDLKNSISYDFESGLLFDSLGREGQGIPDLVYHCRNIEILLKTPLYDDENVRMILNRAISLTIKLLDEGSLGLFFGRSQNSAYGIGSLYYILSSINSSEQLLQDKINRHVRKIESIIFDKLIFNDEITLNLAGEGSRGGCDTYMYQDVYSSFLLSRILLIKKNKFKKIIYTPYEINFNTFFTLSKISKHESILSLSALSDFQSLMMPNDYRYKKNSLQSYVYNGKEVSLIPYYKVMVKPFDHMAKKLWCKVYNHLSSFLFKHSNELFSFYDLKFFTLNIGNEKNDLFHCSKGKLFLSSSFTEGIYIAGVPKVIFNLISNRRKKILEINLPTSTGKVPFIITLIWGKKC